MHTQVMWTIETGSMIHVPDDSWNIYTLYSHTQQGGRDVYCLLGFITAYRYERMYVCRSRLFMYCACMFFMFVYVHRTRARDERTCMHIAGTKAHVCISTQRGRERRRKTHTVDTRCTQCTRIQHVCMHSTCMHAYLTKRNIDRALCRNTQMHAQRRYWVYDKYAHSIQKFRLRVSQCVVLPPFQRRGHGARMLV